MKLLKTLTLAALFHLSLHHHSHSHIEQREEFEYVHVASPVAVTR